MEYLNDNQGLNPRLQSDLERIAKEKQASERDAQKADALEQYTRMVQNHEEEKRQLTEDHDHKMKGLVRDINTAGLSDVLQHVSNDVRPQYVTSPSPQDDDRAREDEKPYTKSEKMRMSDRQEWFDHSLKCMDTCSGAPKHKMRIWLRSQQPMS